jgi:acetyl-CoA C-acetyltransferase
MRQAAVDGGVPVDVPRDGCDRVYGSGAQIIAPAAQAVMPGMLGMLDSAVAGGAENIKMAST